MCAGQRLLLRETFPGAGRNELQTGARQATGSGYVSAGERNAGIEAWSEEVIALGDWLRKEVGPGGWRRTMEGDGVAFKQENPELNPRKDARPPGCTAVSVGGTGDEDDTNAKPTSKETKAAWRSCCRTACEDAFHPGLPAAGPHVRTLFILAGSD